MSELAIVSAREARLRAMAKSGSGGAKCAIELAGDPGRFISTVQTGITMIAIFAGAFSGASLGKPAAERIQLLGVSPETAETLGFGLVIVLTTYVSLVIGEIVPKQIALRSPEPIAAIMARPMLWLSKITAPAVWLLDGTSALVFKLIGLSRESDNTVLRKSCTSSSRKRRLQAFSRKMSAQSFPASSGWLTALSGRS